MNIKLSILAAAILFLGINKASAQLEMAGGKSDMTIKIGSPMLQTNKFNDKAGTEDFKTTMPAIGVGFETGFFKNVSCGFEVSYSTYKNDLINVQPSGTIGHHYGTMSILEVMLFAKYFTPLKFANIATYARVDFLPLAGYAKNHTTDFNTGAQTFSNDSSVKTTYGIYAGANYQLAGPLSAFAEVGYGYTGVNVGINVRIGDK